MIIDSHLHLCKSPNNKQDRNTNYNHKRAHLLYSLNHRLSTTLDDFHVFPLLHTTIQCRLALSHLQTMKY